MAASFISNQAYDVAYWHFANTPNIPAFVRFWSNSRQIRASVLTSNMLWLFGMKGPRRKSAMGGRNVGNDRCYRKRLFSPTR